LPSYQARPGSHSARSSSFVGVSVALWINAMRPS
jgi:hypothetical protein